MFDCLHLAQNVVGAAQTKNPGGVCVSLDLVQFALSAIPDRLVVFDLDTLRGDGVGQHGDLVFQPVKLGLLACVDPIAGQGGGAVFPFLDCEFGNLQFGLLDCLNLYISCHESELEIMMWMSEWYHHKSNAAARHL